MRFFFIQVLPKTVLSTRFAGELDSVRGLAYGIIGRRNGVIQAMPSDRIAGLASLQTVNRSERREIFPSIRKQDLK